MTPSFLHRAGIAACFLALVSSSRAAEFPAPEVVPLGGEAYTVTARAHHKFTRDTEKLKAEATAVATAFCAKQGKQLKVVTVTEKKSLPFVGDMASATLTFKALNFTDPELSATTPPRAAGTDAAPPLTNEALYADLLRLDDLHKKGILDNEEFKAEKKKVLDRSK